jgi:nucleoside-diphosphate-sugar epimerase
VKGKIRVELEQRLEAAARRGTRVIIVRAGDFFGPGAGNNWFAQAVVKPGRPVKAITIPSDRGVGHQWAYLPDVAETMMQLLARAGRPAGVCAVSHGKGSGTMTANSWRTRSAAPPENRSCGRNGFAWWLLRLARPFMPLARELLEMRYLWQRELHMRNDRLVAFLGAEPHTPIDRAVRDTLSSMGCLGPDPRNAPAIGSVSHGKPV